MSPWEQAADFAIGLRPIPASAWLQGGEAAPWLRKDPLFAGRRDLVWGEIEGSRDGQEEVATLVDAALGAQPPPGALPPLYAAARRVADDLCLMEKTDGAWRLTALSLSAPTFFTAGEALGRSLAALHGPVPGFGDRFLARVQRVFDALRPNVVLERRNWTLVNSPELFAPDPAPMRARIADLAPADVERELRIRVERQTVRRLPRTGGAVFTIRVSLEPLAALLADPPRLAGFAKAWRSATPQFRQYKRLDLYDELVEEFLRATGETYSVNGSASCN
ncbi:heme-dependent oxidative N-demethylase subunit alpha family protein [Phenylobacterium sp.]|uniref:heme-dependent oxidative N-demethylase subunit alpha family protein n=1 Tax=Phenylobacterium sp. TaxID=1871053 RepID=UPI002735CDF8|nr:heme-dependent oxidative N-demethylase subunit alpha family protein [Phenylobacterium sp.]MDP3659244.1 DUF3445 domain-containing protein [Phenylobacterium sp.]